MDRLFREACLVDGRWIQAADWIAVDDPATGEIIGRVPALGAAEAEAAIAAAQHALPAWSGLTAKARSVILRRFHDLILAHEQELAGILTREQGKPLAEARGEIAYAASFIEWFAEEAKRVYGDLIPGHAPDKRLVVMRQPIGVVAAITPWNFPAAMITRKIGPALAAGCTVIVKPALETPFTAIALGVLAEAAGVPPGVLNILTGPAREIGGVLTRSPVVRKLSFTGSTEVGAQLYAQCAPTIKKLSLELGGNAPFIVFDDADVDKAVEGALASKFRNAGQTCVCANRLYAQDGIYDAFVSKLAKAASSLKLGHGLEPGSQIGPLINDAAVRKVRSHIDDALEKGARLETGGAVLASGSLFFTPTVLSGATPDMRVTQEETFGPLAAVVRFDTEEAVVRMANASEFGLAAYFFARDLSRVWRVAEALEAGMVGVNTGLISTEVAPFGGIKSSGLGREGSRYGIEDYLELKYVCLNI